MLIIKKIGLIVECVVVYLSLWSFIFVIFVFEICFYHCLLARVIVYLCSCLLVSVVVYLSMWLFICECGFLLLCVVVCVLICACDCLYLCGCLFARVIICMGGSQLTLRWPEHC